MTRVYVRHIRRACMCSKGARAFFLRRGWDWSLFLREGLPVEVFEATGDAMCLRVAEVARGEQ